LSKPTRSPKKNHEKYQHLILIAIAILASTAFSSDYPIAAGPFKPDWESLKDYQCPEWFRDAKFGIWAHWDAQSVPEAENGWYGRGMYEYKVQETGKTSPTYKYHLAHYGHPSKFGFKDIDNLWHAEIPLALTISYSRPFPCEIRLGSPS
jgi:alpha-L-fucosidase